MKSINCLRLYAFQINWRIKREYETNLEESPFFASKVELGQFRTPRFLRKQIVHVNNRNLKGGMRLLRDEEPLLLMLRLKVSLWNIRYTLFRQLLNWWYQDRSPWFLEQLFHTLLAHLYLFFNYKPCLL